MNYAGIDAGTTNMKTHTGLIYGSGISMNVNSYSKNIMTLDGKQYAMELSNVDEANLDKTLNKNLKVNYIYALAKVSENDKEVYENVCLGLPCSQWKSEETVRKCKELLDLKNSIKVDVNGIKTEICVKNLDILPEGASAYYAIDYEKFQGEKVLLLDFGSISINSILFKNDEIVDLHTDEYGVLKVFKPMAERILTKTGKSVEIEDMTDILLYGLPMLGKRQSVKEIIKPIATDFCRNVYKNLNLKWGSLDTIMNVLLIGGSSILMEEYIKEFIPHAVLLEDAMTLSAKGMGMIAKECIA